MAVVLTMALASCLLTAAQRAEETTMELPSALVAVAPGYPPLALTSATSGEVKVKIGVNAEGAVTRAQIISGPQLLREGCQEAAMQWKFVPIVSGKQAREVELTFAFLIAPKGTATAKLTTVFKQPNRIEITRIIPQSEKSVDPPGRVKK